jgi:hypothetical protein
MPPWMYGGGMMSPWGNQMMGGWNPWQQGMQNFPWMQSPWWRDITGGLQPGSPPPIPGAAFF